VRRALFTTFVFEREWLESYLPENIDVVVVKHWNRADSVSFIFFSKTKQKKYI